MSMSSEELIDLDKERRLNKAISGLQEAESTERDLWPDIRSRIESSAIGMNSTEASMKKLETKLSGPRWINWAVAASLVVCVGSLSLSWHQLEKAEAIYAHIGGMNDGVLKEADANLLANTKERLENASFSAYSQSPQAEYVRQVEAMETEFKVAKAGLMARISMNSAQIDEALFKQIETELLEIERATLVLKKAMGKQHIDANFTNLLRVTYQQELTVLTQLAKLDTTI